MAIIFLLVNLNICFGCPKEPSHWDGYFEHTQHMFWLKNKKFNFDLPWKPANTVNPVLSGHSKWRPKIGFQADYRLCFGWKIRNSFLICPGGLKYSKTCSKRPLKKKTINWFSSWLMLNASQKYCRMVQREPYAILLTFIKLSFVFKTYVLFIFEWPLKTGFTVYLHNSLVWRSTKMANWYKVLSWNWLNSFSQKTVYFTQFLKI